MGRAGQSSASLGKAPLASGQLARAHPRPRGLSSHPSSLAVTAPPPPPPPAGASGIRTSGRTEQHVWGTSAATLTRAPSANKSSCRPSIACRSWGTACAQRGWVPETWVPEDVGNRENFARHLSSHVHPHPPPHHHPTPSTSSSAARPPSPSPRPLLASCLCSLALGPRVTQSPDVLHRDSL